MIDSTTPVPTTVVDVQTTGVSWTAIVAGGVTTAALTLMLLAFGAGIGFSTISPWSGSGVSATTFKIGTGIYLLIVAVMASSVGGYLTARLRTRWTGLHTNEVFFRDTAHGLITWAFATVLSAAVLGAAAAHIVGGASQVLGSATAAQATPVDLAVDNLLRPNLAAPAAPAAPGAPAATPAAPANTNDTATRAELTRLLTASFRNGADVSADNRTYLARVVAARTGMSQADAEKRVATVINETKQALDAARKAAMQIALWLTAALLFGAFASSLAAIEGGQLRDGTWQDRRLVPRSL